MGRSREADMPLAGISLLDVGCGAGIVSEPMARLGAEVTAIDASEQSILIAERHAAGEGLEIDYQNALPEDLASQGGQFDVVMSLEVIEHVADAQAFLEILSTLVKPGGALVIGTLNRTGLSYVKAIIGAEYILGWLPKGTHSWRKFVRPSELNAVLEPRGYRVHDCCGVELNPMTWKWSVSRSMNTNYMQFYKRSDARL